MHSFILIPVPAAGPANMRCALVVAINLHGQMPTRDAPLQKYVRHKFSPLDLWVKGQEPSSATPKEVDSTARKIVKRVLF
jgi:hypothetical protein